MCVTMYDEKYISNLVAQVIQKKVLSLTPIQRIFVLDPNSVTKDLFTTNTNQVLFGDLQVQRLADAFSGTGRVQFEIAGQNTPQLLEIPVSPKMYNSYFDKLIIEKIAYYKSSMLTVNYCVSIIFTGYIITHE